MSQGKYVYNKLITKLFIELSKLLGIKSSQTHITSMLTRNRYIGIKNSENQNNSSNSYSNNNGYNNSNSNNNFHNNSDDNIILIVINTIIKQFNLNPVQMNSIIFYNRKHLSVMIYTVSQLN